MTRHIVRWKEFKGKNFYGSDAIMPIADELDLQYRGTLLSRILSMEQKAPLTYDDAMRLTNEALSRCYEEEKMGGNFGQYHWYLDNFIEWISSLGYHIELTGDEFESYLLTDKVI